MLAGGGGLFVACGGLRFRDGALRLAGCGAAAIWSADPPACRLCKVRHASVIACTLRPTGRVQLHGSSGLVSGPAGQGPVLGIVHGAEAAHICNWYAQVQLVTESFDTSARKGCLVGCVRC